MGEERPSVLVVDDDEDHLMVLEAALDAAGFAVQTASTFATARNALESGRLDALVADLTLGDASALDLLRGLGETRPRVALILSGFDDEDAVGRSLAAGFDAHLGKPTSMDVLLDALRSAQSSVVRGSAGRGRS